MWALVRLLAISLLIQLPTMAVMSCETGYGTYKNSSACVPCPQGTYASDNECVDCPAGTYQSDEGYTTCKNCRGNANSLAGASICVKCSFDSRVCLTGNSTCLPCPYPFGSAMLDGVYHECSIFSWQQNGAFSGFTFFGVFLLLTLGLPMSDREDFLRFGTLFIGFRSLYYGYIISNRFFLTVYIIGCSILLAPLLCFAYLLWKNGYRCKFWFLRVENISSEQNCGGCLYPLVKLLLALPVCAINVAVMICLYLVGVLLYATKAFHHRKYRSRWLAQWMDSSVVLPYKPVRTANTQIAGEGGAANSEEGNSSHIEDEAPTPQPPQEPSPSPQQQPYTSVLSLPSFDKKEFLNSVTMEVVVEYFPMAVIVMANTVYVNHLTITSTILLVATMLFFIALSLVACFGLFVTKKISVLTDLEAAVGGEDTSLPDQPDHFDL